MPKLTVKPELTRGQVRALVNLIEGIEKAGLHPRNDLDDSISLRGARRELKRSIGIYEAEIHVHGRPAHGGFPGPVR